MSRDVFLILSLSSACELCTLTTENIHMYSSTGKYDSFIKLKLENKFFNFISAQDLPALPAHPIHVALYLTHILDSGASCNVVNQAVYAIKWAHNLNGLSDPTENSFVKSLQDSAKRHACPKTRRKDPVSSEMLVNLCELYKESTDLLEIRDLTMILLSYAGFLRFDELSSLLCKDISFHEGYISVHIAKSKTDQYRHGDEILISKGSTCACPVAMLKKYVELGDINMNAS